MLAAFNRPRRNRSSQFIRDLLQETRLSTDDLVYPLFLTDSKNISQAIPALPNIFRLSVDLLCKEIEQCLQLGIKAFVIFPVVEKSYKDKYATNSYNTSFFYLKSLKKIKDTFSEALIITDVAMDPYSSDGHDGLLENGIILNDATLEILGKMALAQAATGIDYVGLSDMMDHRVAYIRDLLENNGFTETGIISYTTKYASSFYGPFREALDSNPKTGDKKTYQMNPANRKEAIIEAQLDFQEGSDILLVKPALAYLDIIHQLSTQFNLPIAAYNVSGEYAMIKAADQKGWLNGKEAMMECLLAIKRAGSDMIFTYFAKEAAVYLNTN